MRTQKLSSPILLQKLSEEGFYAWTYDLPTSPWLLIGSIGLAAVVVLLCLFPLAPYKLKIGVVYASLGLVRRSFIARFMLQTHVSLLQNCICSKGHCGSMPPKCLRRLASHAANQLQHDFEAGVMQPPLQWSSRTLLNFTAAPTNLPLLPAGRGAPSCCCGCWSRVHPQPSRSTNNGAVLMDFLRKSLQEAALSGTVLQR